MNVNTNQLVPMTDANQNFSKVARLVDEKGMAVILKNNKPRYVLVDFSEYEMIETAMRLREKKIDEMADDLIAENLETFQELAK